MRSAWSWCDTVEFVIDNVSARSLTHCSPYIKCHRIFMRERSPIAIPTSARASTGVSLIPAYTTFRPAAQALHNPVFGFIKISFAPPDAICYDTFKGYSFSWQEPYHLPDRQRIPDGMQQNKKGKGRRTEKFSGEIFRLTFPWKYTTIRTEKRT